MYDRGRRATIYIVFNKKRTGWGGEMARTEKIAIFLPKSYTILATP